MNNGNGRFFIVLMIIMLFYNMTYIGSSVETNNNNFTNHEKIWIETNEDFVDKYGFSGKGTATDPYIIENLKITTEGNYTKDNDGNTLESGETAIYIGTYVTANYTIRNNYFTGNVNADKALHLESINNTVIIENNTFENMKDGISSFYLADAIIQHNTMINVQYSIYASKCKNLQLLYNSISGSEEGIHLESKNNYIAHNLITNTSSALEFFRSDGIIAHNNTIDNNNIKFSSAFFVYSSSNTMIYDNSMKNGAILVQDSINSTIFDNKISDYTSKGIEFREGSNARIFRNLFLNIAGHGVSLDEYTSKVTIYHNTFLRERVLPYQTDKQGYDDGDDNIWYNSSLKEGNNWNDLGFDDQYVIEGVAGSIDIYPLETSKISISNTNNGEGSFDFSFNLMDTLSVIFWGCILYLLYKKFIKKKNNIPPPPHNQNW